jgi:hypothetical protein
MPDHDIRAPIFGMGGEVPIQRLIWILLITTPHLHDLERTLPLQFSIWSTARESRLMVETVTIVVAYISRQHG